MRAISALFGVLFLSAVASADTTEWPVDAGHSLVGFSVSHMKFSSVHGRFNEVTGKAQLDEADLTKSSVDVSINAASIDTNSADRDKHLKSPDFFDVAKYPALTFKSTKIVKGGKGYKVTGDLKIKDVSKSVTLDGTISPPVKNPWGKLVRAAAFTGKVNRTDFGLKWNKTLDAGGLLVGEEVTLDIQVELDK